MPCVPGTERLEPQQSIMPRGTNLWVWPEKLDPCIAYCDCTAAATLQPHPFSTLNRAPALKTMNKRSLTQAVSKKPGQHNESQCEKHGQLLFTFILFTIYNIIYSQYSCLQLLFMYVVCHNITTQTGILSAHGT